MYLKIKRLIQNFSNPQSLGVLGLVVVALLVSWSSIKAIAKNYELQKKISELDQKIELQKLENENLRLKNAYYETDQYLELTARRVFGKGAPGEKLLLVPKEVAKKRTVDEPAKEENLPKEKPPEKPWYQKNLEAWRDFLLH